VPVTILILATLLGQSPSDWNTRKLRSYIENIELAARSTDAGARDAALLSVAGQAYKTTKKIDESAEDYARRTLKKLDPAHPRVKKDQWLLALVQRLYSDLSQRSKALARFERRKKDKVFFEEKSKQFASYAQTIAGLIRVKVKGLDAEIEPLPVAKASNKKVSGVQVSVTGENISIEQFKRVSFKNHKAPEDGNRTARGSLMSLFNSFRQKQVYAKLMARSKGRRDKSLGKTRLYLPASKPAIYYNEILRAAKEAKLHSAFLMVFMPKSGKVGHITIKLNKPSSKQGKKRKYESARCPDGELMQACVDRLSEMKTKGAYLIYK